MDLTPPNISNLDDVKVYLERMYQFIKWWGNLQVQYMEWQEVDAPEAPKSGRFRIVATQSDDGRTQFIAKFSTGDVLVAIEEFTTDDLNEGSSNLFYTSSRITELLNDVSDLILGDLTSSRIVVAGSSGTLESGDLADWIAGTTDEITVTDDGDGSVTLSLPRFSYANDRISVTNVDTARPIDRTADVITSTTTVANSDTETTSFTGTLGANDLKAGNVLKVFCSGILSNATASDDITINVYIGTTNIESFNPAMGNVTDADWHLEQQFTIRSVGATGNIALHGNVHIDDNSEENNSLETVDTTSAQNITVKVQWDNAKAGNTISIYQGWMEWKN